MIEKVSVELIHKIKDILNENGIANTEEVAYALCDIGVSELVLNFHIPTPMILLAIEKGIESIKPYEMRSN